MRNTNARGPKFFVAQVAKGGTAMQEEVLWQGEVLWKGEVLWQGAQVAVLN